MNPGNRRIPKIADRSGRGIPESPEIDVIPLPSRKDLRPLFGTAEGKDLPVLASIVNGKADYFVTGDNKLISLIGQKGDFPFRTVNPAEFLDRVLPVILGGKRRG
jgi:hypothetical protein